MAGTFAVSLGRGATAHAMGVISIQSQVAFGHVGNSAAVFPMQSFGIDVRAVPTALLSNRPGYPTVRGRILDAGLVGELLKGLEERGAVEGCRVLLSGYLGSAENASVVAGFVTRAKKRNPSLLYCCDPVIGDAERGIYVAPGLPELFRDALCPSADIVTPNQFELGWLTGRQIRTFRDLVGAARTLAGGRSATVLVTGVQLWDTPRDEVATFAMDGSSVWSVTTPKLRVAPSGTGDLLTALYVALMIKGDTVDCALRNAVSATYAIIKDAADAGSTEMRVVASGVRLDRPGWVFEAIAHEVEPAI